MTTLRLLFALVMIGGVGPLGATTASPPFALALTLNDGAADVVYPGWPLLLRGDAVLMRDVPAPIALDLPSLALEITSAAAAPVRWPLLRVTEFASPPLLGATDRTVRVVWLLAAGQTVALPPGDYRARLLWAGQVSPPVEFSVAPAPLPLPADEEVRRALLQSQASLYLGDTAGAITALGPAEALEPESIELLVQRARVLEQRGEYPEALQLTRQARSIFYRDYPTSEHPPMGILEVESRARAKTARVATSAPQTPGLPRGGLQGVAPSVQQGLGTSTNPAAAGGNGVKSPAVPPAPTVRPGPPDRVAAPSFAVVVPSGEINDGSNIADASGQWAASATAGTQYGKTQYSAAQATGAPNISVAGNSPDAWCPASKTNGTDWLEVAIAKPVHATEVRIRQNDAAGAIVKIEVLEPDGTAHVWWEGADPYVAPTVREIAWFAVRVPKTGYLVAKVKITLNLATGPGWKEIDAVQLVGRTD
jgi:hypothetical protein